MKAAPNPFRELELVHELYHDLEHPTDTPPHCAEEQLHQEIQTHHPVSDSDSNALLQARHAAPLLPLRDRDLQTLSDWFTLDEIDVIEADILSNLTRLLPEPCWEDNPFDFLQEYL